jgi:hypothetical protein
MTVVINGRKDSNFSWLAQSDGQKKKIYQICNILWLTIVFDVSVYGK